MLRYLSLFHWHEHVHGILEQLIPPLAKARSIEMPDGHLDQIFVDGLVALGDFINVLLESPVWVGLY